MPGKDAMMENRYRGKVVWIFPDNFDVDQIMGVRNLREGDLDKLLPACMQSYDPEFAACVTPGDLLVGGKNFGYGHPHHQGMALMRKLGIRMMLADSFASTFYRNEVTNGMALLEVPGISAAVERFDELEVDFLEATVHREGALLRAGKKPPAPVIDLVGCGDIRIFIARELGRADPA